MATIRYFGFGREATYGTGVNALMHVDMASSSMDSPANTEMIFKGGLGRSPTIRRPGPYEPSGGVNFAGEITTLGWMALAALGGYVYTVGSGDRSASNANDVFGGYSTTIKAANASIVGATSVVLTTLASTSFPSGTYIRIGTPNGSDTEYRTVATSTSGTTTLTFTGALEFGHAALTPVVQIDKIPTVNATNLHELYGSTENSLPSYTFRIGKDIFEHVFEGSQLKSFGLKLANGFLDCSLGVVAQKDSSATIQAVEALLLPTAYPFSFPDAVVAINGVDKSALVKGFSIDVSNALTTKMGVGSRFGRGTVAGDRNVTFSLDVYFESMEMIEAVWGSAHAPTIDGSTEASFTIDLNAGQYGNINIQIPRGLLTGVKTQSSGKDIIVQNISGTAMLKQGVVLNSTSAVATDILVTISNLEDEMTAV
jgi:hypothetical protein